MFKTIIFTSRCIVKNCWLTLPSSLLGMYGFRFKQYTCNHGTTYQRNLELHKYKTSTKKFNAGYDAAKADIILKLNFKSSEDALPFYKLPMKTLLHINKVTKNDERCGYCENRLYYISSHIGCHPSILSVHLANRVFIYTLSFDWLKKSLNVLLDMGVPGNRILRDLWVLKYNHETIEERLQRVKNMGVDKLYPWMVRCSEEILNRSITISQETRDILGDSRSTLAYLASRLEASDEEVDEMCLRIPALKTIRVTKVKHFLDFLIKEGFDVKDIAVKPRVLSASQKTVQRRLEKLRNLGLSEINLNVLCRSKKDFNKYCESVESTSDDDTNDAQAK